VTANNLMPRKKRQAVETDPSAELLKDLLIVELAKAKVPHQQIRRIVGCGLGRVSKIARFFKTEKQRSAKKA